MDQPIGLQRGTVRVLPYDPKWQVAFQIEKQKLLFALSNYAHSIEHIGSTSVPGLDAKPIIDMIAAVDDLSVYRRLIDPLTKLGYESMPERVFDDRVFFPKGPRTNRTHHLSLVVKDSKDWTEPILFRDYLRGNPEARQAYALAKHELAERYPNDRTAYTTGKEQIIAKLLAAVRAA